MTAAFELLKLRRSRRPWLAIGACLLYLVLMLFGFYTYARAEAGDQVEFRYTFENESYFNGLTFSLYGFYFGFLMVLPVFAATEGGAQIAGETGTRSLHLLLTRPLSRTRIFFTKFLVAAGYVWLLTGLLLGLALGTGLLAVGWGELNLYPGVLQMTERPQSLTQDEALQRFCMAWPAASFALLVPLALSFWFSTWMKSAVNAVGTSVSLYLVFLVISQIQFFRELRPWLFTSDLAFWRELFQEDVDWSGAGQAAARLAAFLFVFLALGYRRFRRREEL